MPERVAIVTGAGRGIGLATVERLLADGFVVAAVDVSERLVAELATRETSPPGRLRAENASVTDRGSFQRAVSAVVSGWGRVDVLVNNAGINKPGGVLDQRDDDWDAVLAVNLKGAFVATSVVARVMQQQGSGSIVNVGSIGAAGLGASPAYAASKAGLIGLTRQAARELGPHGIRVNLVAPGVTTTEWVERYLGAEGIEGAARNAPLRRAATAADIAAVIAFLASDDSRHLTGQVISASGGAWMP
jgi:NAD(P)-dependent dehydrogenase (short-subunit alcohol dehydrogenase family)